MQQVHDIDGVKITTYSTVAPAIMIKFRLERQDVSKTGQHPSHAYRHGNP